MKAPINSWTPNILYAFGALAVNNFGNYSSRKQAILS